MIPITTVRGPSEVLARFYFRETSHVQNFVKIKLSRNGEITLFRAGHKGVVYGGALQAKDLNRAAQAVSGARKPLLIGGGFGGGPPGNFLKSMPLRMHFRPF